VSLSHKLWRVLAGLGLSLATGCTQSDVVAELRSLSGSEAAVFLCRDGAGVGHPYTDCPDRNLDDDLLAPENQLSVFSLVTQTVTDEVAVVDVTGGHVVDVDPSQPGYGFLRVGGRPVSLATTPGGRATFVATADVGRNGLFALPTRCLTPPVTGRRELTSWPACRLDETPGQMTVLVETEPGSADGDCKLYDPSIVDYPAPPASGECWENVVNEGGGAGRRKLLVTFPDSGKVRVYDAQDLLDVPPGYFPDCQAEREFDLKVDVPQGVAQTLPADLLPAEGEGMCSEVTAPTAPAPGKRGPQPAGLALSDDNRLYIADQAAPVIHVLDTSSVCNLSELPSLLPMSLREPQRIVTTRRVAVSPLTPAGQRFVYAIDAEDQPGASVMAFDVSPGSTNPTPLVRSGSVELRNEKPDRLWLRSAAKDVTFAYRDIPYVDGATGAAQFGTRCDPDPNPALDGTPAALARPNGDYTAGARPGLLRGLFGFILHIDGSIAVVDVDDFDAACRRPIAANASSVPDFRGCSGDADVGFFTQNNQEDGPRLVTNEVSCRVVEPHRVRSQSVVVNDSQIGINAPSLRSFPQLTLPTSAVSAASEERARLLAVPFADASGSSVPAEVYVGSTRYSTAAGAADQVPTNPNDTSSVQLASLNAVVLPPLEPRSYSTTDSVTLKYEGDYAKSDAGFLDLDGVLRDPAISFCAARVYDVATMTDYGARELGLSEADAATFGKAHADYVQLTTGFLDETDSYWSNQHVDRDECIQVFGESDAETLLGTRDLSITSATAAALTLVPRGDVTLEQIKRCFPAAQQYKLRAGQHWVLLHGTLFRHDVVESGVERACVRSCNPLKKWEKGRVFEISSDNDKCRAETAPGDVSAPDPLQLRVGCAGDEVACVYDQTAQEGVRPGGRASECIFNGLNDRFALYRGRTPSVRDETFAWQTTGGFAPAIMSLASVSSQVSPQSIQFLQQAEQLAVVDGSSQGLSLFSLDTFSIVKPSPFY
jgi:hypothetical protein